MRSGIIMLVLAGAVLAIAAPCADAALVTGSSVTVKVPRPGAAGSLSFSVENSDDGIVPEVVKSIRLSSRVAAFNGSAVTKCTTVVFDPAYGGPDYVEPIPFCPPASKVGTGAVTFNTGSAGSPLSGFFGTLYGTIDIYNYTFGKSDQAALLFDIQTNVPVPNAHTRFIAPVSRAGVLTIPVPSIDEQPPSVANILAPPGSHDVLALAAFSAKIKSPRARSGRLPFFTLKNNRKLDFTVTLNRG
jgi:hypothetical protein